MLDHFGEEHFCPLTIFKVLGVLVEYDAYMGQQIDDTASDMDSAMVSDVEDLNGDSDGPKNLFASAKGNTVYVVIDPTSATSVVIDPTSATSVVIDPTSATSVVIDPTSATSVVIDPTSATSVIIDPT
ncbi:uncharacterized protein LOC110442453 [Mizuhopecten yessoensis]|uniref:uncharacterized protein LOC110442453 n=1 Tax=Mizuhopecten yessoensis TaxID=6573 RepID=UPI000B45E4E3|nr:uncharacterized protein LOC110442453 [Mizuhopecten yessoensis]